MSAAGSTRAAARASAAREPRLRCCFLLGRYLPDFAGAAEQTSRLLPHLEAEGIDPVVVTRRTLPGVSWRSADDARVERILPATSERFAHLRGTARLFAHVLRSRGRYDVAHVVFSDWEFYWNARWMQRLGIPLVYEMVLLGSDDPVSIRNGRLGRLKFHLVRDIDAWVGIAERFRPRILEAGIPEERFHVAHPGVDVERFRPPSPERRRALRAELGLPEDARVVVSVGSLLPRKGMDRLLAAWERLRPRPGRELLLLLGPKTEAEGLRARFLPHVRELERRAASPALAGTVRMPGRVDDVERWMAAADVFALLSRKEGFGTVIAEALASGLPAVVSPLEGIAHEIVDEGASGHVIEDPDDDEAVAERLRGLLESPERRERFGREGVRRTLARYSLQARAARLAAVYREVAAARGRARGAPEASAPGAPSISS